MPIEDGDSILQEPTLFSSLTIGKEKFSILDLIRDAQEFDPQYRQISSQLRGKLERNFSFTLAENSILRKADCIFVLL